jgi:putative DNA primase/helicase
MSAEDGLEDTILPRLRAAGADLARVGFFEEYNREPLVLPDHLDRIEVRLRDYGARLLVIDPLAAYLAHARTDQDVRKCLHPLKLLAERLRCTVQWLRHLNKGGGAKAIYRGSGYISIIGAARAGLLVAEHPDDRRQRVLAQAKGNLAPPQRSLTYAVEYAAEHGACRLKWGGPCDLTADDLVRGPLKPEEKEKQEETRSKFRQACAFLGTVLKDGPLLCRDVKAAAAEACLSERTVERAAAALGLRLIAPSGEGSHTRKEYRWALPDAGGVAEQAARPTGE